MNPTLTRMVELEAANLIAEAELRNNLLAVRDRHGCYCYTPPEVVADDSPIELEVLDAVDAGIAAGLDELEIVRGIRLDEENMDRCGATTTERREY